MNLVRLNVGGVVFLTSKTTLEHSNSFFSGLMQTDSRPGDEEIFIDRDPTHFRHILNYMRGTLTFPLATLEIQELIKEAEFYSLSRLVQLLETECQKAHKGSIPYIVGIIASKMG